MSESDQLEYPRTVAEAVERLLMILDEDQREQIASSLRTELIDYHFDLAYYIRNGFGLWSENSELLADCRRYAIEHGRARGSEPRMSVSLTMPRF